MECSDLHEFSGLELIQSCNVHCKQYCMMFTVMEEILLSKTK